MEVPVFCNLTLTYTIPQKEESLDPAHTRGDYTEVWIPGSNRLAQCPAQVTAPTHTTQRGRLTGIMGHGTVIS